MGSASIPDLLARCTFEAPVDGSPLACAVSGGPDSMALLILATEAVGPVRAIHVDHGLRAGSAREADLVAAAAARMGAEFEARSVVVEPGPNLEARARSARYAALPADVATGHTADDQAETIVLALLRGAALHGLAGMAPGPRHPLLALRRAETEALCAAAGIDVVRDPSNLDPAHRRNRVRHEALPLLADIAGRDLVPVLTRQAELLRQAGDHLTTVAEDVDPTDGRRLAAVPQVVAREAVRNWIRVTTGSEHPPDLATVDRVLAVARHEARATDVGSGWEVRRTAGLLRLVPPQEGSCVVDARA